MESLGQDEVKQQVQPARLDVEGKRRRKELEMNFGWETGVEQSGVRMVLCMRPLLRAWTGKLALLRSSFWGLEKSLDELFVSKGEEWRLEKENMGEEVCFQYLKFK